MAPTSRPAAAGCRSCDHCGLAAQFGAEVAEGFGEEQRGEAAEDSQGGVGEEFAGVAEVDDGDAEHRLRSPEGAGDDDAGDGREDDGAEDGGAPLADDLFDDEEDGGDGRVEGGGEASGGSDGGEDAELFFRHAEAAADERGDAGADLEGWVFGAERVAAADGEGGEEELADDGAEGDVAVVDVECGLGLVDAAAADVGEDVAGEDGDDEARGGGNEDKARLMWVGRRAEQQDAEPLDGHAEGDDEQAGDDADEDGEQKEDALFAARGDAGDHLFFEDVGVVGSCSAMAELFCIWLWLHRFGGTGEQEEQGVVAGRVATDLCGLSFGVEDEEHGGVLLGWVVEEAGAIERGFFARPFCAEVLQRRG